MWRNFYKLFPRLYLRMQEHVTTQKDGDIIEIYSDIHRTKKFKLKVINNLDVTLIHNHKIKGWFIHENNIEKGLEHGWIKKINKLD